MSFGTDPVLIAKLRRAEMRRIFSVYGSATAIAIYLIDQGGITQKQAVSIAWDEVANEPKCLPPHLRVKWHIDRILNGETCTVIRSLPVSPTDWIAVAAALMLGSNAACLKPDRPYEDFSAEEFPLWKLGKDQKDALKDAICKIASVPFDFFRDDVEQPARFAVLYMKNGFVVYITKDAEIFLFRMDARGVGKLRKFFWEGSEGVSEPAPQLPQDYAIQANEFLKSEPLA